jgi:hypothetical protein
MRLTVVKCEDYAVYAEYSVGIDGSEFVNFLATDFKHPDELHSKLQLKLTREERLRLADFLMSR